MMYGYYGDGFSWGWPMLLGGAINIIFWIIILVLIFGVIRGWRRHSGNALDILRERYAKGEINKEEFETKKKDLME